MEQIQDSIQKHTRIYKQLLAIGKGLNETIELDELLRLAGDFVVNQIGFERCLIFVHNDENGWFSIQHTQGYDNPMQLQVIKIINLLLSGEVIDYLRLSNEPITHTPEHPNVMVASLVKSLFLKDAYFEIFGGDITIPFGLIVVGNGIGEGPPNVKVNEDEAIMIALGNFILQLSNTVNNIIFYSAWRDEKQRLNENIERRTNELLEQKQTFEAIYKTTKDGIALLDAETSAFLDANDAYAEMTGFTKQELYRTSCIKMSVKEDVERAKQAVKEVVEKGFLKNFIKSCYHKSGHAITINMSLVLMSDRQRILVSAKDITQQKALESSLFEQKQKAEDAARAKSEFLANMSHEIRTPMNAIIGMSYLALESELNAKQQGYVEHIQSSANSLLRIINDILDFSKIEAGKLHIEHIDFDLFRVVDEVINLNELKAFEKGIELIVLYQPDINQYFFGDPLRLSQILTNLFSNAIKFTENGEVVLLVKRHGDNSLYFEVKDTGIGMSEAQQKKLFASFSQADGSTTRKYGGSGLGLAISKQLVNMMNGSIDVSSIEGEGSRFYFHIELPPRFPQDQQVSQFGGLHALVSDGHKDWGRVLKQELTRYGFVVDLVANAEEMRSMLLEKQNYDLWIIDSATCQESGGCFSVSKPDSIADRRQALDSRPPHATIITGYSFEKEPMSEFLEVSARIKFLKKPINPSKVYELVSELFLAQQPRKEREIKSSKSLKSQLQTLRGSRILLAEDNRVNQKIIEGLLNKSGIAIDIAENGQQAIKMFDANIHELILMDIQMPLMDGYQAASVIRSSNDSTPIIALTANAMVSDVERSRAAGMNEHLNKPIDVNKLYKTLLCYLGKKSEVQVVL